MKSVLFPFSILFALLTHAIPGSSTYFIGDSSNISISLRAHITGSNTKYQIVENTEVATPAGSFITNYGSEKLLEPGFLLEFQALKGKSNSYKYFLGLSYGSISKSFRSRPLIYISFPPVSYDFEYSPTGSSIFGGDTILIDEKFQFSSSTLSIGMLVNILKEGMLSFETSMGVSYLTLDMYERKYEDGYIDKRSGGENFLRMIFEADVQFEIFHIKNTGICLNSFYRYTPRIGQFSISYHNTRYKADFGRSHCIGAGISVKFK